MSQFKKLIEDHVVELMDKYKKYEQDEHIIDLYKESENMDVDKYTLDTMKKIVNDHKAKIRAELRNLARTENERIMDYEKMDNMLKDIEKDEAKGNRAYLSYKKILREMPTTFSNEKIKKSEELTKLYREFVKSGLALSEIVINKKMFAEELGHYVGVRRSEVHRSMLHSYDKYMELLSKESKAKKIFFADANNLLNEIGNEYYLIYNEATREFKTLSRKTILEIRDTLEKAKNYEAEWSGQFSDAGFAGYVNNMDLTESQAKRMMIKYPDQNLKEIYDYIVVLPRQVSKKNNDGSYFKFNHTSPFDLKPYQICHVNDDERTHKEVNQEHCFLNSVLKYFEFAKVTEGDKEYNNPPQDKIEELITTLKNRLTGNELKTTQIKNIIPKWLGVSINRYNDNMNINNKREPGTDTYVRLDKGDKKKEVLKSGRIKYFCKLILFRGHYLPNIKVSGGIHLADKDNRKPYDGTKSSFISTVLKRLVKNNLFVECRYNQILNRCEVSDRIIQTYNIAEEQRETKSVADLETEDDKVEEVECGDGEYQLQKYEIEEQAELQKISDVILGLDTEQPGTEIYKKLELCLDRINDPIIETEEAVYYADFESIVEHHHDRKQKVEKLHKVKYTDKCRASTDEHFPFLLGFIGNNDKEVTIIQETSFRFKCELITGMFNKIIQKNIDSGSNINKFKIYFHNLKYDFSLLRQNPFLSIISEVEKGGQLYSIQLVYKKHKFTLCDSFKMISASLSDFNEMFDLGETAKMDFNLYGLFNTENVFKNSIEVARLKNYLVSQGHLENIDQELDESFDDYIKDDQYFHIRHYTDYLALDCKTLQQGMKKFYNIILTVTGLSIFDSLTISSLASKYLYKEGCFEGVNQVTGNLQRYISKAVTGGRVCSKDNMKYLIIAAIMDFDGVSLYPSAMKRITFPKGNCENINIELGIDKINELYSHYFIRCKIKINKKQQIPMISIKNDEGVRVWTNDTGDHIVHIDKITYEDLVEFQDAEVLEIYDGVGWLKSQGVQTKINTSIQHLFDARLEAKACKNTALSTVLKLVMNSAYGKTLLTDSDYKISHFRGQDKFDSFVSNNYNFIQAIEQIDEGTKHVRYRAKVKKNIVGNWNYAHIGAIILSMSKRIMNEMLNIANDNGINIYYTDTDSVHMKVEDIPKLAEKYKEKYGRELIGKQLGQFHSDFESKKIKGKIWSEKFICLGKKCYLDKLVNKEGDVDYHARFKGAHVKNILAYCRDEHMTIEEFYTLLYNGETQAIDLCNGKVRFKYKDGKVFNQKSMIKKFTFTGNKEGEASIETYKEKVGKSLARLMFSKSLINTPEKHEKYGRVSEYMINHMISSAFEKYLVEKYPELEELSIRDNIDHGCLDEFEKEVLRKLYFMQDELWDSDEKDYINKLYDNISNKINIPVERYSLIKNHMCYGVPLNKKIKENVIDILVKVYFVNPVDKYIRYEYEIKDFEVFDEDNDEIEVKKLEEKFDNNLEYDYTLYENIVDETIKQNKERIENEKRIAESKRLDGQYYERDYEDRLKNGKSEYHHKLIVEKMNERRDQKDYDRFLKYLQKKKQIELKIKLMQKELKMKYKEQNPLLTDEIGELEYKLKRYQNRLDGFKREIRDFLTSGIDDIAIMHSLNTREFMSERITKEIHEKLIKENEEYNDNYTLLKTNKKELLFCIETNRKDYPDILSSEELVLKRIKNYDCKRVPSKHDDTDNNDHSEEKEKKKKILNSIEEAEKNIDRIIDEYFRDQKLKELKEEFKNQKENGSDSVKKEIENIENDKKLFELIKRREILEKYIKKELETNGFKVSPSMKKSYAVGEIKNPDNISAEFTSFVINYDSMKEELDEVTNQIKILEEVKKQSEAEPKSEEQKNVQDLMNKLLTGSY